MAFIIFLESAAIRTRPARRSLSTHGNEWRKTKIKYGLAGEYKKERQR
jgi:hypothetical protein